MAEAAFSAVDTEAERHTVSGSGLTVLNITAVDKY